MTAEIKHRHQTDISPSRKQLVVQSAKIAVENGRARLVKNAQEQTK